MNLKLKLGLILFVATALSGCHTIRPSQTVDSTMFSQIEQAQRNIGIVFEEHYTNYQSTDRGDPLADPQTYKIGEALVPLTQSYFKEAFLQVEIFNDFPESSEVQDLDYIVRPRVSLFDNELAFLDQEITVKIAAELYDRNLKKVTELESDGFAEGNLGILGMKKKSGRIVSRALQEALQNMVKEIQAYLSK